MMHVQACIADYFSLTYKVGKVVRHLTEYGMYWFIPYFRTCSAEATVR